MIKRMASCPYCREGEVAYDCQARVVTFNPDSARQQPCDHLISIQATYCRGEVFPNGARKVGVASVAWQNPHLSEFPADELPACLQKMAVAEETLDRDPSQQSFHVNRVHLEGEKRLSREKMVRWLDQVGWDKCSEDQLPGQDYQLNGMIVFARRWEEFLSLLNGQGREA